MRLVALSICSLIWITLVSSLFYLYLILKQFTTSSGYKMHRDYLENMFHRSWRSEERARYAESAASAASGASSAPNETFRLYEEHLANVRHQIVSQLSRWELNGASPLNKLHRLNPYEVTYEGPKGRTPPTRSLLCSIPLKLYPPEAFASFVRENVQRVSSQSSVKRSNSHKMSPISHSPTQVLNNNNYRNHSAFDPSKALSLETVLERFRYPKTCAMISNAASMLGSGSGVGIDTHEIVLRFNDAPAPGPWAADVGTRTHVRIINSQLIENGALLKQDDQRYAKVVNVVWDTGHYRDTPAQWYARRGAFFAKYEALLAARPDLQLFLLDTHTVWAAWNVIQSARRQALIRNPVSSGFLGAVLLTQLCEQVTLYEYIPTSRSSVRCHYYDNTTGSGCTMGDWHPLASEKLFLLALNENDNWGTFERGQVRISGCRSI